MEQPIVEIQALVVLPVQDLARQVFLVFQKYCKGTNVKVALATGQGLLDEEQKQIVKKGALRFLQDNNSTFNTNFIFQTTVEITIHRCI